MTQRVALPFFGADPLPWARPSLGTFSTWLNQTAAGGNGTNVPATATATDNANGMPLVIRGGLNRAGPNPNACVTGLLKSIGPPPWTVTAAVAFFSQNCVDDVYCAPLILYDSGNDKLETIYWSFGSTAFAFVYKLDGTSPGVFPTRISGSDTGFVFPDYFAWFRVVNDGADLTYYVSPEGQIFEKIFTEPANTFLGTIDKVGFGFERGMNSTNPIFVANTILWDWREA